MRLKRHSIDMRTFLLCCLLLGAFPLSSWAQLQKLPSVVAKELLGSSASAAGGRIVGVSPSAAAVLSQRKNYIKNLEENGFEDLNTMLEDYFTLNPQAATSKLLQQNKEMQRALVAHWLERDAYAYSRKGELQKNVQVEPVQGKIDYLNYIPYDARLVLLGEVHEINWMAQNVEEALMQFKRAHPDKNIYYASEFVDAPPVPELYILKKEKEVDQLVVKRPYYRPLTKRLLAAGVWVVGLENPALSRELLRTRYTSFQQTPLAWKTIAPSGMQERNQYWAQIIRRIYAQDPDAVVFIHAGMGHTDYNQPFSLPLLLKEFKPFVVEYSSFGIGDFNTLLERNIPIPISVRGLGRQLQQSNPSQPVFLIRWMKSKRSALVGGCDLHIQKVAQRRE